MWIGSPEVREGLSYTLRMTWRSLRLVVLAAILLTSAVLFAQTPKDAAQQWRTAHEQQILQEFTGLLSIPNVASDNSEHPAAMPKCWLQVARKKARFGEAFEVPGANPVVFGEIKTPGAKHTIVFYAHYDGQPVTPADWDTRAPSRR